MDYRPTRGADKQPRKTSRIVKEKATVKMMQRDKEGVQGVQGVQEEALRGVQKVQNSGTPQSHTLRRSGRSAAPSRSPSSVTTSSSPSSYASRRISDSEVDDYSPSPEPDALRVMSEASRYTCDNPPHLHYPHKLPHNAPHIPAFAMLNLHSETHSPMLQTPTTTYLQSTYWDLLIAEKMSETRLDRSSAVKLIVADVWRVFSKSDFIATLFHLPSFYDMLTLSRKRGSLEPALVYALLAISYAFLGSSEKPNASSLKLKSMYFAETAHKFLTTAISTTKWTLGVAQAAVCLHYYEFLPKPVFDVQKLGSAIIVADAIIRKLALPSIDAHKVDWVYDDDGVSVRTADAPVEQPPPYSGERGCPCNKFRESVNLNKKQGEIVFRVIPKFNHSDISDEEVVQEEVRRVVFGALNQAWNQMMFHPTIPLHISDSSNYGIYLSAERWVSTLPDPYERSWSRRTIYGLIERAKLLCLGAIRLKSTPLDFHMRATKIIAESENIESELNKHTCTRGLPFWHIFNIAFIVRLILTAKLRHLTRGNMGPKSYFSREQANGWLISHVEIYRQYIGDHIREAPMIFGVLSIQALRCLDLYELDKNIVGALKVAQGVLSAIEQVLYYHPCSSRDIKAVLHKIKRYNFEEESIKHSFAPDVPQPGTPTVEELSRYLDNVAEGMEMDL